MNTTLIKYMEIHLISLEQDLAELSDKMESLDPNCKDFADLDFEFNWVSGQIAGVRHIMDYAKELQKG